MKNKFYLDTSIWLDFFENRNEPNFPKGEWARELIAKIMLEENIIVFSDNNLIELLQLSYSEFDINEILQGLEIELIKVEGTERQIGIARDLASKRKIPRRDALHALIARDNQTIFVTLDHDFQKLLDIIKPYRTNELL